MLCLLHIQGVCYLMAGVRPFLVFRCDHQWGTLRSVIISLEFGRSREISLDLGIFPLLLSGSLFGTSFPVMVFLR